MHVGPLGASDAVAIARLHAIAFPGFFLSSLGSPFLVQFYRGFVHDPSAIAVVARSDADGAILGAAVGTVDPARFYRRLLRRRLVGFGLSSARAVVRRPRLAPRLCRAVRFRGGVDPGRDGAVLSSIFVTPSNQHKGVGTVLLKAWTSAAAASGARSATLTTDAVGNDHVNRFYLANGWRASNSLKTREGRLMNVYTIELGAQ